MYNLYNFKKSKSYLMVLNFKKLKKKINFNLKLNRVRSNNLNNYFKQNFKVL